MTVAEIFQQALAMHRAGKLAEAETLYRQSIAMSPSAEAHNNLGSVLLSRGEREAALEEFNSAVRIRPDYVYAHNNAGTVHYAAGRNKLAEAAYRRTIELAPGFAPAYRNLGKALRFQCRFDDATAQFRKAIELDPNSADAHVDLGILLMMNGHLAEGYREYEWRLRAPGNALRRSFSQAQWDGRSLEGKTLLAHDEGGYGDAIMYARFVSLLKGLASRLILECRGELFSLFASLGGADEMIERGAELPRFDMHVPLTSLPAVLGTVLKNLPNAVPYLRAPAERVARWRERVGVVDRIKVGLVWAANRTDPLDKRSVELKSLAPLASVPGVRFFNLQMGADGKQERPAGMEPADYTAEIGDFADTAALVEQLDLVISVDTSVAHLAGALGKPVWLLVACVPAYQWMLDRTDSPWYPTMRIFRQTALDDWREAVTAVAEALKEKVRSHGG